VERHASHLCQMGICMSPAIRLQKIIAELKVSIFLPSMYVTMVILFCYNFLQINQ